MAAARQPERACRLGAPIALALALRCLVRRVVAGLAPEQALADLDFDQVALAVSGRPGSRVIAERRGRDSHDARP